MSNLKLNKRDENIPNSAKKARRDGKVPGIIYGKTMNNYMFEVGSIELAEEIVAHGEHGILEFTINGENHKGLIKELQKDPVTHKVIHLDLEELKGKDKIVASVPIHYIGEEFINQKGNILQREKDTVKIECPIDSIPKCINMNVGMGNVGSVYKLCDLEVASELYILDDLNSVMASISYERKTVSDDMEAATDVTE